MKNQPCTELGTLVSTMDLNIVESVKLPPPASDGRIPTMNQKGFMTVDNDEISQSWIDYSSACGMPVFDGGAAYGVSTIAALKKGAIVVANDSSEKHLEYIAKCTELTDDDRKRLYLRPGLLPGDFNFQENTFGAIHLCRVLHFFHPEEWEEMILKAKKWLIPGGRLFIVQMSPWHHFGAIDLAEIYEKKYQEGNEWPGEISDFTINSGQSFKGTCSEYLHCIDPRVMMREATKFGFIVKKIQIYGGPNDQSYTGSILINTKKI